MLGRRKLSRQPCLKPVWFDCSASLAGHGVDFLLPELVSSSHTIFNPDNSYILSRVDERPGFMTPRQPAFRKVLPTSKAYALDDEEELRLLFFVQKESFLF